MSARDGFVGVVLREVSRAERLVFLCMTSVEEGRVVVALQARDAKNDALLEKAEVSLSVEGVTRLIVALTAARDDLRGER